MDVRRKAFDITSAFEGGNYDSFQVYDAGIISYGKFQFTLASGNLSNVLEKYLTASDSDTAEQLREYRERAKRSDKTLQDEPRFKTLMQRAAKEKTMQDAQDTAIMERFWTPAMASADARGVTTHLGVALFFDMAVQHGPYHSIIQRAEGELGVPFKSKVGENGVTEQQLIARVADVRKRDLYALADKHGWGGLRVRADFWENLVKRGDWFLLGDAAGNVDVNGRLVRVRKTLHES